ncbi:hypothetical protein [Companilactobacillus pabuli]|jgi:hypothetical protein|uniref:Uncharacterized protein n=1 Tax=Companilactobacillus pabuli TaxID=2714036 RepID=A0A7L7KV07_9LACO|nr:hypothetical protein [Companilactobacillus pabuli]AKP02226.1 hypothetical protein ABB45_00420 [Companilactobacillus farciminis]AKS50523.1 hypothetical protein ABB44_00420 [Companilactobacillus farciminis]MDG5113615.1 hypothetical protein [Companilactobacillus pabuli]QMT83661.1 hypothetical protein G6534_03065 [Companilactobacillus pabuli]GAQ02327.1 hypothetical protein NBRC111452_2170 [Companilactobacillus farciminis]
MSIYTADIILFLLLVSILNNPLLNIFQALGWNFLFSEVLIGVILLAIVVVVHKFLFSKFLK